MTEPRTPEQDQWHAYGYRDGARDTDAKAVAAEADAKALAAHGQHDPACKSRSADHYDADRLVMGDCSCEWGAAVAAHDERVKRTEPLAHEPPPYRATEDH